MPKALLLLSISICSAYTNISILATTILSTLGDVDFKGPKWQSIAQHSEASHSTIKPPLANIWVLKQGHIIRVLISQCLAQDNKNNDRGDFWA